jgi:hypothetical protein
MEIPHYMGFGGLTTMENITHEIHKIGISNIFREKISLKYFREKISLKDFKKEISLKIHQIRILVLENISTIHEILNFSLILGN